MAISGHITGDKDFLIVQALEFTDPEEILCVGTKSLKNKIHYSTNGYSIAVKPRQGQDFWMQAPIDFDSGTAARKCVKDIGQRFKGRNDYYSYIPDLIKKELDLSQREYTKRLNAIKNCTTLDEIGKIDYELEQTIRKILKENKMFEGILRPEPMGVLIPKEIALNEISQEVLDYINLRGIRLI